MISILTSDPVLPSRPKDGHKGTFGSVAVFGGSCHGTQRMLGAPSLVARSALRAGCGLARVIAPEPILSDIMTLAPSATGVALAVNHSGEIQGHVAAAVVDSESSRSACLAIGPGLGGGAGVRALVLRAIQKEGTPVVLDADGLNVLCEIQDVQRDFRAPAILTPHPGEFARLASALAIGIDPIDAATRIGAAGELARRMGCIAVLKGHGTVVSDGLQTWTCEHGHPCLATAGTGDVLTGIIAGLVSQWVAKGQMTLFDAARAGVLVHALAGETWAKCAGASGGMLAEELLPLIPRICESLRA